MLNINKYILEKLHITKDLKTKDKMAKGVKIVNTENVVFTIEDFISCDEPEEKLINFIINHKSLRYWENEIDVKRKKFNHNLFNPNDYDYLISINGNICYFGGKNKLLKYVEDK